jgi:hypothetical protein
MPTARPFAFNPGAPIVGTEQVGQIAVGITPQDYSGGYGGVRWWNGPDEDLGYVIAQSVPDNSQPTQIDGVTASVGFFRSGEKTGQSFVNLSNTIASSLGGGPFLSAAEAKEWLNDNGYWTSYFEYPSGLIVNLDAGNVSSYPGSGSTWTNLVDSTNYTINNGSFDAGNGGSIVFNGTSTFVPIGTPLLSGTNYSMEAWVNADIVTGARNILSSSNNVFWNNGSTLSGGVGGSFSLVTSSSFPANVWRYVVLTFNDATNTMRLYINGTQVSQNLSVTQSYVSETLRIGSHFGLSPISFWDGKISQVRVYNQEISSSSISSIFNSQKSRYGL